ncbi:Aldehyde Dehydrogenase [Syntrophobotulus glycolicus DSM 8271]|uniref:Aldehyde dehydrogenase n=1 Tax=Syntrophobotulus glycolicus (strain DSM 8271 / FlGlyR) TaxID=645991 RepID=F0SU79_SYNGF|nr:Aldehyde Dehydrogenase [Syntrophobotulus glycolicus DSM 8271]
MTEEEIRTIFNRQRAFFSSGKTLDLDFRREALRKLKTALTAAEEEIISALGKDLRKPLLESYSMELGIAVQEIDFALKNLRKWARPQKVKSPLLLFPAKSAVLAEPYGLSLIISPWNYPFQLTFCPLVSAIAAGNCCIVKPSEYAGASEQVIKTVIARAFDSSYIAVVEGDAGTGAFLLEQDFDKIFFTGSPAVGRIVMEKAARNLASVTLELGGKSPCIVDREVNPELTARRILFGKLVNTGQTCIAPDYLIVHREIKESLYAALGKGLRDFFGENPQNSPDLGRIINKRHFDRLKGYLSQGRIILGGGSDEKELYLEPTVIEVADLEAPLMREEIFGPVLPVVPYTGLEEIEGIIARNPNPLALYLFTRNKETARTLTARIPFGGGCVNDTLFQAANQHLPFGGRGGSGSGSYHGRYGFEAFSHKKALVRNRFGFDLSLKYPPYQDRHKYLRKYLIR